LDLKIKKVEISKLRLYFFQNAIKSHELNCIHKFSQNKKNIMAKLLKKKDGKDVTPYTENIYDATEDIYNKAKEEKFIDEDDPFNKNIAMNENNPGAELDIPGGELDDEMEKIGEEDEENNYYSLGGDDHENLEEDQA
jgi:hypothetical protein